MLQITYLQGSEKITKILPDSRSRKFIEDLYKAHKAHPFFWNMDRITKLRSESFWRSGKKRMEAENKLKIEEAAREKYIALHGIKDPGGIKLEIIHI